MTLEKSAQHVELADAHCHLHLCENPQLVIKKAISDGVTTIITAGGSARDNEAVLQLANGSNVFGVIGIDPSSVAREGNNVPELEKLLKSNVNVRGIGEIGLDIKITSSTLERQQKVFVEQIALAKRLDVPIVIHSRGMIDEVIKVVEQEKVERAMFHYFEGNAEQARLLASKGFLISIPPTNLEARKQIIKAVDISNIVAETDAPVAGKEPSDVIRVVEMIALAKEISFGDAAQRTAENVRRFFYI